MSSTEVHGSAAATIYRLRADVHWREIDGEIIALDMGKGRYVGINASAGVLWSLLSTGATSAALAARLVEAYSLPVSAALSDVENWLGWLREEELLAS